MAIEVNMIMLNNRIRLTLSQVLQNDKKLLKRPIQMAFRTFTTPLGLLFLPLFFTTLVYLYLQPMFRYMKVVKTPPKTNYCEVYATPIHNCMS